MQGEAGCYGVDVAAQVACEAGEAGQLAGFDSVDPAGEHGAKAVREYLAEAADALGGRVQLGAVCQDGLQGCAVVVTQGRGMAGEPVSCRTVGGGGGASGGEARRAAI